MDTPEPNGKSRLDRLEEALTRMQESVEKNWGEHERIWRSIEVLRTESLEVDKHVTKLVEAIRDLIDRIPPENLK